MPNPTDDLETKVEDAFIELLTKDIDPEIKGVYAWADQPKDEPCIIVQATRGEADSTQWGDIMAVEVMVTLRQPKRGARRGLFRCVEDGVGVLDGTKEMPGLAERLENASVGSLGVSPEPTFGEASKSFEENKIVRSLPVNIRAYHKPNS